MKNRKVYMDHNATTPLHPEVKNAIIESLEIFGNASSFHGFGRLARSRIEAVRNDIAEFIGAKPDELIFVGSGSEANNTVLNIFSCLCPDCGVREKHKKGIITTRIEHPCVLETAKCLNEKGVDVRYLDVDKFGKINVQQLDKMLSGGDIGILSVIMANNEIGTIQDIKTIAELAHKKGVLVHTDAVQAVGKIFVDVRKLGVDFLSFSGHKIYGPKGIGALYVKEGVRFCPLIRGGHQEKGRRAGTENTIGIIGLGSAVYMRKKEMKKEEKKLLKLKNRLKAGIEGNIRNISFNGHPEDSLASTLNVSFDGAEGEAILLYLDMEGIAVSTGSACASGSLDPSHVLLAVGLPAEKAHGSIRFSMGRDNTEEDVDYVVEKLTKIIERIRKISSAYKA